MLWMEVFIINYKIMKLNIIIILVDVFMLQYIIWDVNFFKLGDNEKIELLSKYLKYWLNI